MDSTALVVLIAAVAFAVVVLYVARRRIVLKAQFGPEYEWTVHEAGSMLKAESDLASRARRVNRYYLRALSPDEGDRFTSAWRAVQTRFIDDPAGAVDEADRLLTDLIARLGYPIADFDQRVEDLSVDHGEVVGHYRQAHQIADRQHAHEPLTMEDLRRAVTHYRALFEDLLDFATPGSRRPA